MTSVSNAYLSQVERGLHQPSLKVLHSIAAALQLSTEQLLAQAGWASGAREAAAGNGTEEAIRTDPRLTPEQRAALLGVYRSFVDRVTTVSHIAMGPVTAPLIDILNAGA